MLTIVGGPMFSGKTTWLIEYTKKLPVGSYTIFKPNIDTRYATNAIVTHNGQSLLAKNLNHINPVFPPLSKKTRTILIDELNFFKLNTLMPALQKQMRLGRHIVGVGLLFDSYKKEFGATAALSMRADTFIELVSVCDGCGKKIAKHSYRKTLTKKQVLIGAGESYGPSCDTCWNVLTNGVSANA
jgi:thymidine kinase